MKPLYYVDEQYDLLKRENGHRFSFWSLARGWHNIGNIRLNLKMEQIDESTAFMIIMAATEDAIDFRDMLAKIYYDKSMHVPKITL